jgi:hypothetical protein
MPSYDVASTIHDPAVLTSNPSFSRVMVSTAQGLAAVRNSTLPLFLSRFQ